MQVGIGMNLDLDVGVGMKFSSGLWDKTGMLVLPYHSKELNKNTKITFNVTQ